MAVLVTILGSTREDYESDLASADLTRDCDKLCRGALLVIDNADHSPMRVIKY